MKALATHIDRAALRIRAQLITARTSMANQLRGLLKLFGLRMGTARTPGRRAERLTAFYAQRPDLKAPFAPLIASMEGIEEQLRAYNRPLNDRAKADEVCARLMSVPGVGPITALTYTSTIEESRRFARSDDVGAYAGLVPRRSQSGERDVSEHISKAGDPMLRKALYEAANVALTQVKRPFALQAWSRKMAEAKGARCA
jgi:transposase